MTVASTVGRPPMFQGAYPQSPRALEAPGEIPLKLGKERAWSRFFAYKSVSDLMGPDSPAVKVTRDPDIAARWLKQVGQETFSKIDFEQYSVVMIGQNLPRPQRATEGIRIEQAAYNPLSDRLEIRLKPRVINPRAEYGAALKVILVPNCRTEVAERSPKAPVPNGKGGYQVGYEETPGVRLVDEQTEARITC